MTAYNDPSSYTYRDKNGIEVVAHPGHFTSPPYGISSSRRWWMYLWDMKPENHARYIEEWYRAGLVDDYQLWDVLGSFGSPVSTGAATEIYEALGLEPLAGFPLKRKEA